MYCASCGAQNEDAARFCESCGSAMAEPAPVARRFEPEPSARHEAAAPPVHVANYLLQAILVTVVTSAASPSESCPSSTQPESMVR